MDPTKFLFDAVSQVTGGMITDIKTAMTAIVLLSMILMGADLLKIVLFKRCDEKRAANEEAANYEMADYYHREMREYERGTVAYDIARSRYRHYLKKLTH